MDLNGTGHDELPCPGASAEGVQIVHRWAPDRGCMCMWKVQGLGLHDAKGGNSTDNIH
jgi:hypothetical protein